MKKGCCSTDEGMVFERERGACVREIDDVLMCWSDIRKEWCVVVCDGEKSREEKVWCVV